MTGNGSVIAGAQGEREGVTYGKTDSGSFFVCGDGAVLRLVVMRVTRICPCDQITLGCVHTYTWEQCSKH